MEIDKSQYVGDASNAFPQNLLSIHFKGIFYFLKFDGKGLEEGYSRYIIVCRRPTIFFLQL